MLEGEHSAVLLTFIKLPFVSKIFILSIFEWSLKTGLTVIVTFIPGVGLYWNIPRTGGGKIPSTDSQVFPRTQSSCWSVPLFNSLHAG